jgi:hypothetical protein
VTLCVPSDRSPILDAIGCALLRAIGREGIQLSRFEDEDELQPMNNAAAEAEDDDAVIIGPMIDKAFFSQLASNARTITDTNWVQPSARLSFEPQTRFQSVCLQVHYIDKFFVLIDRHAPLPPGVFEDCVTEGFYTLSA